MPRKRNVNARDPSRPSPTKLKLKYHTDDDVVCIKDIEDCQVVLVKGEVDSEITVKKEPVEEVSSDRFQDVFLDTSSDRARCEVNNNSGLMNVNDEILNENITNNPDEGGWRTECRPEKAKGKLQMIQTPPPIRRIHLEPSKQVKKARFGASKFEAKYDTRLLDRFFIQKTLKTLKKMKPVRVRRRRLKERWCTFQKIDSVVSFRTRVPCIKADHDMEEEDKENDHDDTIEDFFEIVERELQQCKGEYIEECDVKEVHTIQLKSTSPVISSAVSLSIPESSANGSSCDTLKYLFDIAFYDLEMFLRDERNHDAMMNTIEEIVKDVSGAMANDEVMRGCSGSDDESVIVLSDDEFSDHETTQALTMTQLRVLESCWRDWPFPSKDMVTTLCSDTGLGVPAVTAWFIEKNKTELERFKL